NQSPPAPTQKLGEGRNEQAWKELLWSQSWVLWERGSERAWKDHSMPFAFRGISAYADARTHMKLRLVRLIIVLVTSTGLLTSTAGTIAAVDQPPDQLMKQGLQSYQRGAFDKALGAWKQAAQLYAQQGKAMEQS